MSLSLDPELQPLVRLVQQWDELDAGASRAAADFSARIADLVLQRDEIPPKDFNAKLTRLVSERTEALEGFEARGTEVVAQIRAMMHGDATPSTASGAPLATATEASHGAESSDDEGEEEDDDEGESDSSSDDDTEGTRHWPASATIMVRHALAALHRPATMRELASRVASHYKLPLDAVLRRRVRHGVQGLFKPYVEAIEFSFGKRVRYAQILKTYYDERESDDAPREDMRLSGRRVVRSVKRPIVGSPDEAKISTSYVERSNLTTRMWVRRLTRLTTCFSRRLVFLRAAMSFHFAVYNLVRVHESLRVTPAVALGVTDHVWSMQELVERALRAVDDAPPPCAPPTPPTEALVPGVRARKERRSAARKAAKAAVLVPDAPAPAPAEGTAGLSPRASAPPASPWSGTAGDFRWMW